MLLLAWRSSVSNKLRRATYSNTDYSYQIAYVEVSWRTTIKSEFWNKNYRINSFHPDEQKRSSVSSSFGSTFNYWSSLLLFFFICIYFFTEHVFTQSNFISISFIYTHLHCYSARFLLSFFTWSSVNDPNVIDTKAYNYL